MSRSTPLLFGGLAALAMMALPTTAHADPRVRGGFSLNGGYYGVFSDTNRGNGGSISLGGRIGVQISDVFSLYYQNSPLGFFLFRNGPKVGASDFNTILADFTIEDTFGVGFGPSLDLVTSGAFAGNASPVEPGGHVRISLLLGSSSGFSRRQSFAIGLDPHVTYFDKGVLLSLAGGIGAEWY
jgi:hypothetical protein